MRDVLREGGILVVSTGISDITWREKPRFIPEVWCDEFVRLFVVDYLEEGARLNVIDLHGNPERKGTQVWSMTYNRVFLRDDT